MRYVVDAPMVAHLWAIKVRIAHGMGATSTSRAKIFIPMGHISDVPR